MPQDISPECWEIFLLNAQNANHLTPAQRAGVYLHFPFCESKCNYCDFYSARFSAEQKQTYITALCSRLAYYGAQLSLPADTLYLGGGTPTTVKAEELVRAITAAKRYFGPFEEITVEANPADRLADTFVQLQQAGVNRVSLGVQSAAPQELKRLGRRHTPAQVQRCVRDLRAAGITNLSLDLMLGIPEQTEKSLQNSIDFCLALHPQHISAYMLKIEPDTFFGRQSPADLPSEDQTAALYLLLCTRLREAGFMHYEISNFCKPGYESRHNLKYWKQAPYLGLGPGAHSFIDKKRFYFPRDMALFLSDAQPVADGSGGDAAEFIMLRLRLAEGLDYAEYRRLYGRDFLERYGAFVMRLQSNGLAYPLPDRLCLTEQGFLLSNTIIAQLLS